MARGVFKGCSLWQGVFLSIRLIYYLPFFAGSISEAKTSIG